MRIEDVLQMLRYVAFLVWLLVKVVVEFPLTAVAHLAAVVHVVEVAGEVVKVVEDKFPPYVVDVAVEGVMAEENPHLFVELWAAVEKNPIVKCEHFPDRLSRLVGELSPFQVLPKR